MSWITEEETEAIQHLRRDTPYIIQNVSQTQLSIARHYGGCKFNGDSYIYHPETDELIRSDVLRLVMKQRKASDAS